MFYVNDIQVTPTIFPDKTSQIWNIPEGIFSFSEFYIRWEFENEGEIMHLAQLNDLLRKHGRHVSLHLKYLPYGRQDKAVSNDTTFALHSFAKLINAMNFDWVEIVDPHSKEAIRLIERSRAEYPFLELKKAIELTGSDMVCYPDAGALEKYSLLFHEYDFIYGSKVRDQLTGKILKYELKGQCKDKIVMITDDICDGGATFTILAKELYAAGAKRVHLFVTHGIFSKGFQPLHDAKIAGIFTQDGSAIPLFA